MRPKTLALLALVVGALAAFIAFYERDLPSPDERREREGQAVPVDAEDLTEIAVDWQGTTVRFTREPKAESPAQEATPLGAPARDWRIVEPIEDRADRGAVDRLAGDLAGLKVERMLEGAARADVGLEPPRGTVRWKTPKGEGSLEIGGKVPASSNVVVASSARSGLLVVPGFIVEELEKKPGEWRAREVVAATRDEIRSVTLAPVGGERVVLVARGQSFGVEAPYSDLADRGLVDPLLSDLLALKVSTFLDPPLAPEAEATLATGPGRIELGLEGRDQPFVLEVGAAPESGGDRTLRADGVAFRAPTNLAEALARGADEWRSKNWTSFDSFRVESLKVEDASGSTSLVRSSGDWLRDGTKIGYAVAGDLLYAIASAKAESVAAGDATAAYPLAEPTLTVTVADGNGVEEVLTLHGPAADGRVVARVSGRDVVLLLPQAKVAEIEEKLAAVRSAEPLAAPAAPGDATPTLTG
ncbi:MAG: DUF4340 domain-containing protein [Acidobacteria bacterium]|nr:DUF4340 domain-containing protein [Acidobacteriota bacterium]